MESGSVRLVRSILLASDSEITLDSKDPSVKLFSTTIAISSLLFAACSNDPQPAAETSQAPVASNEHPTSAPTIITADEVAAMSAPSKLAGEVLETMNSGGYTYVLVDTGDATVWTAGPVTSVAVGDVVSASGLMEMAGFHSNTLGRDFEMIYFASALSSMTVGAEQAAPVTPAADISDATTGVAKAEGGYTVEDIFLKKDELVGKEVIIHANVVKFSADIMKTNWIHLQDGSGSADDKTNDLTITTDSRAAVGDVITVRGILTADKDFGFGYKYALIIEGAAITAE